MAVLNNFLASFYHLTLICPFDEGASLMYGHFYECRECPLMGDTTILCFYTTESCCAVSLS